MQKNISKISQNILDDIQLSESNVTVRERNEEIFSKSQEIDKQGDEGNDQK